MTFRPSARVMRVLWALALFGFLAAGAGSFFLPATLDKAQPPVRVMLKPGLSLSGIAARLEDSGVIRSRWAFTLVAAGRGAAHSLKAGTYAIAPHEPLPLIVDRLRRGDVCDTSVTIPEGLMAREIAERVAPVLGCTTDRFMAAVQDSALSREAGVPAPGLEGYLFPDTYRLIPGTDPREFVRRLVGRTLDLYRQRFAARADSLGLSRHQVLTLASLVEAEAAVDDERPRIAAVFFNRLKAGMKLQSDPTVAYVLGSRPEKLYSRDLTVESPYNTYLVSGLPPGPICSPGLSSCRAVLYPTLGCRDYYFVAAGNGRHLFSATNDAHNEARRRVAQGRSSGPITQ